MRSPGQAEALCELVAAQRPWLARQLGAADAEDAVQETYLAALRAIDTGAAIRDLESYVRGIARLKAIREIRCRQARRGVLLPLFPAAIRDPKPDPEQALLEAERRERAIRTLERLRPASREVLIRFYVRDEPREMIETEMNISPTKFRLLKSRALRRVSRFRPRSLAA